MEEPGDELAVLAIVAGRLDAAGLAWMVTGSMALNYYARPRMTRDVDVVVALELTDADRVVALFARDFICEAEAVRDAIRTRGMFNLIHREWVVKVDIVVRKDSAWRIEELGRRRRVRLGPAEIAIVTAEDLLLSKLEWARESRSGMQLGDERSLIASVDTLDWGYIEHRARALGIALMLAEVRS